MEKKPSPARVAVFYCPRGSVGLTGFGMDTRFQGVIRHNENVAAGLHGAAVKLAIRHSPAAGAKLGSQTSQAKAEAAQDNGAKGGRPKGS
jgi:hypothetical protein